MTSRSRGASSIAIDAERISAYALEDRRALRALSDQARRKRRNDAGRADKDVDIDDVVRIGDGQRVIGYTYADDRRRTVYFDPEFRKLRQCAGKALPNLPLIDFVDASADGQKLLMFAGSDTDPGRLLLFDKTTKRARTN